MLKMYTAHTQEADDIESAVDELKSQIDTSKLFKNTIGILTFHFDYAESGILERISREFPFDLVGMTTIAGAETSGYYGTYSLFLTVLTSDDVEFSAAMSVPLDAENYKEAIAQAYTKAAEKLSQPAKFVMTYAPYLPYKSGADITVALDEAVGGLPCWGGLSSGVGMVYEECRTLYKEKIEQYALALIAFAGNIDPAFIVTSIPERNMRDSGGIVTESDGCVLKKINDMPLLEYLDQLGIAITNENCTTLPFMVHYEGSKEPVAIGIYRLYDDGGALFGTQVPVGTRLVLSQIDREGVLETTQASLEKIWATGKKDGLFMFPCISRYIMLAPESEEELALISRFLQDKGLPYLLAYSGGEICPIRDDHGKLINRFHNYSFSSVVF